MAIDTSHPLSYKDILHARDVQLEDGIKSGVLVPLIFPQNFGPLILPVLFLLVHWPQGRVTTILRFFSFSVVVYSAVWDIKHCRTVGMANGYGIGLISVWAVFQSASLLIFNDVQRNFKRIERTFVPKTSSKGRPTLRNITTRSTLSLSRTTTDECEKESFYRWQPYPMHIWHRIMWCLDLAFSFRGVGWSWRISTLPPLPTFVSKQLAQKEDGYHFDESANLCVTKATLKKQFTDFIFFYILLDILKIVMMKDPYFWGLLSSPPPSRLLYTGILGKFLAFVYRSFLSGIGIVVALRFVITTAYLFPLSFVLLFPWLRSWTFIPIEVPWFYPDLFGSFYSSVLNRGLFGVWSDWWHQLFRAIFSAPSTWIYTHLPTCLQKPFVKAILRAFIAFTISGLLHSCGSYTQLADTEPLSGTFLFFFLQALGMTLQNLVAKYLFPKLYPCQRLPQWLRRAANLVFVIVWCFTVGHLLADDFARGGLWLYEPIPFSPLRGLGFGAEGEGWSCWHGKWVTIWKGENWWQHGIRIV